MTRAELLFLVYSWGRPRNRGVTVEEVLDYMVQDGRRYAKVRVSTWRRTHVWIVPLSHLDAR